MSGPGGFEGVARSSDNSAKPGGRGNAVCYASTETNQG